MQRQFSFQRWSAVLLALFLFVALAMAMPGAAQAERKINFVNKTDQTVYFCLLYRNTGNTLITRGWWKIEPGKSRQFKIETNDDDMYYYAKAEKYVWQSNSESDLPNYLAYIVDSEFHTVTDVNQYPPGKNPRMVWFKQIIAKNGTFNLSCTMKKK